MTATVLALALSVAAHGEQVSREPALVVEAHMSTGGVGGQSWSLRLSPSGAVSVRVVYMTEHSGVLLGDFNITAEAVDSLREVVRNESFLDLPSVLSPTAVPIHCLTARLSISVGERRHTVSVNEPSALADDPEAKRFLAVWRALFAHVPLEPLL